VGLPSCSSSRAGATRRSSCSSARSTLRSRPAFAAEPPLAEPFLCVGGLEQPGCSRSARCPSLVSRACEWDPWPLRRSGIVTLAVALLLSGGSGASAHVDAIVTASQPTPAPAPVAAVVMGAGFAAASRQGKVDLGVLGD